MSSLMEMSKRAGVGERSGTGISGEWLSSLQAERQLIQSPSRP
jgi:hypothetical protein